MLTVRRAHLSTNRPSAYPCLSLVLANIKYNASLGVFFHYFTHLYHPTCRPFRGKTGLLDDITMQQDDGAVQEGEQEDEDFDMLKE